MSLSDVEDVPTDKVRIYAPSQATSDETMLLRLGQRNHNRPLDLAGETKVVPMESAGEADTLSELPNPHQMRARRRSSAFGEMATRVEHVPEVDLMKTVQQHNEEQSLTVAARLKRWVLQDRSIFSLKLFGGKKKISQQYRRGSLPTDAACYILDPKSPRLKRWDVFVMILLVYTAVVTPYEVAFIEPTFDFWFIVNRLIDASFTIDLVFQFLTARFNDDEAKWVYHFPAIASIYLRSWFAIDLVSILPFDVYTLMQEEDSAVQGLRVLRVVRLMRLLKLARILRASRIFARWENQINLSYSVMSLIKFMLGVTTISHWMACAWRIVVDIEADSTSWLDTYSDINTRQPIEQYGAAIYWAIMTITTIGYGDLTAKTNGERILASACMLLGASVYAYVVGAVCGIVSGLDEATSKFHQTMDQLNNYMAEYHLPKQLQYTLREYFRHCRVLAREKHYQDLLHQMSPTLRGQVAVFCHSAWILKVPFFNSPTVSDEERQEFIIQIAMAIEPFAFAPNEAIIRVNQPAEQMYIVQKGVVAKQGVILRGGSFFGEDMILKRYKRSYSVRTLTYVDCFQLEKEKLMDIIRHDEFPATRVAIRRAAIALAFRIKFVALANAINIFDFRGIRRRASKASRGKTPKAISTPMSAPPMISGGSSATPHTLKVETRTSPDAGAGARLPHSPETKEEAVALPGMYSRKGSDVVVADITPTNAAISASPAPHLNVSTSYRQLNSTPNGSSTREVLQAVNNKHQQLMEGMMLQFNKLTQRVEELAEQVNTINAAGKRGCC